MLHKSKLWMQVRDSFWFVPTIYGIAAIFLVVVIHIGDTLLNSSMKDNIPKLLETDKDTAKKLYATLVTAILTMTTISFSVIMVVLTTYSSQFSPRVLQDFMKSRFTQHVLGIYCSGFIFALILLLLIDFGDPLMGPLLMVAIAIICLGSFVYFIHHASRWLQVNSLVGMLKKEGSKAIRNLFNRQTSYHEYSSWNESEVKQLKKQEKTDLTTNRSGYIQRIDWEGMVNWAKKNNYVIELHIQIGSFVPKDYPLLSVMRIKEKEPINRALSFLMVGMERSDLQDVEFTIQKIVEIALRAISPSTNDPHTAINCINRIGGLLIEVGSSYNESPYLADDQDQLRVMQKSKPFEDYLYKSFYQIRHYGKSDVSVIYGILEVLYKIAVVSQSDIKQEIWSFHYYILDVVEWEKLSKMDQDHLQNMYEKLEECCKE